MKQEEFQKLCEKHGIKKEVIEFDILSIEKDAEFCKEVTKKVMKTFEDYACMVESIIHPEQTLAGMHENAVFSEQKQMELLELFRKLMRVAREGEVVLLEQKDFVEYINKGVEAWQSLKPELVTMSKEIANSWQTTKKLKEELEYLG